MTIYCTIALLSMSARHHHGCRSDRDSSTDDASDAASNVFQGNINTIKNTETQKIIHLIWPGNNSIPIFSFLGEQPQDVDSNSKDSGLYHNDDVVKETSRNFQWNECMQSWEKHCPSSCDWTVHLWTKNNVIDDTNQNVNNHCERQDREQSLSFHLAIMRMHNAHGYQHAMKS